jgi:hypothetical protein
MAMIDEERLAGPFMTDEAFAILLPHHVGEVLGRQPVDGPQSPSPRYLARFFLVRLVPGPLPLNSFRSALRTFRVQLPRFF